MPSAHQRATGVVLRLAAIVAVTVAVGLALSAPARAQTIVVEPVSAAPGDNVDYTASPCLSEDPNPAFLLYWDDTPPTVLDELSPPVVGEVKSNFSVPAAARSGAHRIRAVCQATEGYERFVTFEVVEAPPSPSPSPSPTPSPSPSPTPTPPTSTTPTTPAPPSTTPPAPPSPPPPADSGPGDRDRSEFPKSVTGVGDISLSPSVVLRNLGLAALLMLLVGFPAELFNRTVEEHYDELSRWFGRRGRHLSRRPWPAVVTLPLFGIVAAFLYALLDPRLTNDRASLALVIGLFVAVLTVTVAFELPAAVFSRARAGGTARWRVYPKALAFAALCVAVSRLASFRPGYV